MASTQGIRAGRAFVELFADDSKLVRGLRRAQKKVKAFGDSIRGFGLKIAGLGSAMLAPLAASAKVFSGFGDQVAKMAKRTGLSVETLSELRFVASQTGTEFESLEMGFRRMQRSIYDAGRGLSTAKDALADLGLRFEDLDGLSPEQQFKLIGEAISHIEDPTKKAAIAMTLFGRTGTNLLPMFASGAKGIEVLQAEARRLGLTMSSDDAKAAEDFTDALDRLWKVVKMGMFNLGAALAPLLEKIADTITQVIIKVSAWIKQNRQLIVTALKVVAGVIAVGVAIAALGTLIGGFASVMGGVITIITTVAGVFSALATAIGMLISPIGLAAAAVVGLGGYMVYTSGVGGKALQWLGGRFNVLKEDALSAYQGIADAMAAGDMSLAIKVLWLTIKMEWARGVNFLEKAWLNFRDFFIKIGYDAWHGLLAVVETVWHALEVGWIETTAFFSKAWQGFVGFFSRTWENIKAAAKKAWNWIKSLFDDSIDLQTENKLVEQQKQAAISQIDNEQQRKIAEREAERQSQRDRAAALHEATLSQIGKENLDKHNQLDADYAKRMSENEADLAKARQEWRDAIAEARKKKQAKEDSSGGGTDTPDDIVKRARDALSGLGDIGDLVQAEAQKIGVKGTFNAAAVQGLAASDVADRTAKATEETAKNTKRLVQAAQTGSLTFA